MNVKDDDPRLPRYPDVYWRTRYTRVVRVVRLELYLDNSVTGQWVAQATGDAPLADAERDFVAWLSDIGVYQRTPLTPDQEDHVRRTCRDIWIDGDVVGNALLTWMRERRAETLAWTADDVPLDAHRRL